VKALIRTASGVGTSLQLLGAIESVNEEREQVLATKIVQHMGEHLEGPPVALWALASRPETSDTREAPSLALIAELARRGTRVQAYDWAACAEAARVTADTPGLSFASSAEGSLAGADALIVMTEWKEFRTPDFSAIMATLKAPLIFNGRNLYDPEPVASFGLEYPADRGG